MAVQILILDDEPQIRKFLRISLQTSGYTVNCAENGQSGLLQIRENPPDLLILDLGLPDIDGQELISQIREISNLPIIVLSVRANELDKVEALDRGANDYMVKPFGISEFMARVRVVLRQNDCKPETEILNIGEITVDLKKSIIAKAGKEIHLSKKERDLFYFLLKNSDHVLTHKQILKGVWGIAHVEDTAYLRVYISQLRQKLEKDPTNPQIITTESGIGYRLRLEI